ncbi:MAG: methylated-DNA--[protein]-cysteine S-methyltransferase [Propionibacteriaceae bacterium]|jgi:methylated-DNA-[protein]-cysteine S-methyltransferase|nr:methylated-DNA--[protein]-cysteine S-methyltransferase [Propionibacteriaceae bacterium]
MTIRKAHYQSGLGTILAAVSDGAVTGLWFEGQRYFPAAAAAWDEVQDDPVLPKLFNWLDGYFAGDNPAVDFPLAPQGTPFQQRVWSVLRDIRYGEITTYGAIATSIAAQSPNGRTSARAVGGAVGHNPISLVIPCHRVIGSTGSLTGYAGGLDRKTALLQLEGGR